MPSSKTERAAKNRTSLEQDNEILYEALDRLVRAYQFRDRRRVCYYELSLNECYALQTIMRRAETTQNDLAAELLLDKSTTSRLVANMEDHGYISRDPDPTDARAHRLTATPAGRQLYRKIRKSILERQRDLISDLPDKDRRAAIAVMQRLAESATRSFDQKFTPGAPDTATPATVATH